MENSTQYLCCPHNSSWSSQPFGKISIDNGSKQQQSNAKWMLVQKTSQSDTTNYYTTKKAMPPQTRINMTIKITSKAHFICKTNKHPGQPR